MKELSKDEMKKVMGGVLPQCPEGETACVSNSNCAVNWNCEGVPGCCVEVTIGTHCTSDTGCGNGQSCVDSGYGYKWCNASIGN